MADNTVSNFTIYDNYYQTAYLEELAKNLNVFNAASNGAIVLRDSNIAGNYVYETMFDLPDTVDHRDNTSTSDQSDEYLTDTEKVSVKVNMKYKPVKMTHDAWKKKGMSAQDYSTILGAANARLKQESFVTIATSVLAAKIASVDELTNDITSDSVTTMNIDALAEALSKFGDKSQDIVCWVMHSKPYWNLVRAAITDKIYEEAGTVVYGGSPGTLGKPVIVTDGGLVSDDSTPQYYTLGLTTGALEIIQSEADTIVTDLVTGEENLAYRIQGEFAFNLGMRGCTWDVTHGGANPTIATLAAADNWDNLYTDVKHLPGVCVLSL